MSRLEVLSPEDRLAAIRKIAARTFESHLDLQAGLRSIYHLVHDTDPANIDRAEVERAAPDLMRELFAIRMELRGRIAAWQEKGILLRPAEIALRDVFRIARYASDMLGEVASGNARLADGEKSKRGRKPLHFTMQQLRDAKAIWRNVKDYPDWEAAQAALDAEVPGFTTARAHRAWGGRT